MTDQELVELRSDQESDRVERKASLSNKSALSKAICAFLESVAFEYGEEADTIYECVRPLIRGVRDVANPVLEPIQSESLSENLAPGLPLPKGQMEPIGYTVQQHSVRLDRPVKAYRRWIRRMPDVCREEILDESSDDSVDVRSDPHCLALLKHYRSFMPLAQEARKPMFKLKYADGAIGAHAQAAKDSYGDFKDLADEISRRTEIRPSRLAK